VLEGALVDQIAAGEVVERPASVVKELLENAIDAESTSVRVEIAEGGRDRIVIADDGVGMSAEDAALAVQRHATSKLRSMEDFRTLATMGFRGEALPSIASVSRFRLTTCERGAVAGTEVRIEGGSAPAIREVGRAPGTTIEVADLFFNVPARRKFLRARQTEASHVADICLRVALAHPRLKLTLQREDRVHREYLPAPDRFTRATRVFSELELRRVRGEIDAIEVEAALSTPEHARVGPRHLLLFVNDRPIVDRSLARVVAQAFGDALEGGHYPRGVVWLKMAADRVDVNAHPQKTEVRFARARAVYDAVLRVIAGELETKTWGAGIEGSALKAGTGSPSSRSAAYWDARLEGLPTDETKDGSALGGALAGALREAPARIEAAEAAEKPEPAKPEKLPKKKATKKPARRLVGTLSNGLLLVEMGGALRVLSPVALARRALEVGELRGRALVFPDRVDLDAAQAAAVVAKKGALGAVGLEVSLVGERTAAVHEVPTAEGVAARIWEAAPPGDLLLAALDAEEPRAAIVDAALSTLPRDPALGEALLAATPDEALGGEAWKLDELQKRAT